MIYLLGCEVNRSKKKKQASKYEILTFELTRAKLQNVWLLTHHIEVVVAKTKPTIEALQAFKPVFFQIKRAANSLSFLIFFIC